MYYYVYSIQHCWRVCKHCYIPLHIHLLGVGNGFAEPAFARQHARTVERRAKLISDAANRWVKTRL